MLRAPTNAGGPGDNVDDFSAIPAISVTVGDPSLMVAPQVAAAMMDTAADSDNDNADDFGDFDDASAIPPVPVTVPPAAASAAASQQQMQQQPTAAEAALDGPDVLRLTSSDFLSAVLDAWQVLGAPEGHKAAAAQQPTKGIAQPQQAVVTATLPWVHHPAGLHSPNIIRAYNGLPLRTVHSISSESSTGPAGAGTEGLRRLSPDADLVWHGSASEARLVDGLGLWHAIERALAQSNKDAAGHGPGQQVQQHHDGNSMG